MRSGSVMIMASAMFLTIVAPSLFSRTSSENGAGGSLRPLTTCGRALCAGNERFQWIGVTAFGLADQVADGRVREARAFVEWARNTGFNILRVLAMLPNGGWLDLSPADGRRALPQVFALAREHGMYVHVVALANTNEKSGQYRTEDFLREQVREVGRLCAAAGNCVLELANEPYHPSQARLENPELMRRLQQEVPAGLPVAWGAAHEDGSQLMAGGSFIVAHVPRNGDRWVRVARAGGLANLSAATGKFVVDSEPIGAAETPEPDRRDSAPEAFFAQGALSRLIEVGATFHCSDCLPAKVPGPVQQECAASFVAGRRVIASEVNLTSVDPASPSSPVKTNASLSNLVFSATDGDRAWVLLLGPAAESNVEFRNGWRGSERLVSRPGVILWSAVR
jgi:hypothetical protein